MLVALAALAGGVALLVVAAEWSVTEAESVSERFGISPVIVGALVVGLGTSVPEMVVSVLAATQRDTIDLAIGNVIGSNAANVTLVLGAGALITEVAARRSVYRREGGLVIASTVLLALLLVDGSLSRPEGGVLVASMVAATIVLTRGTYDPQPAAPPAGPGHLRRSLVTIVAGLAGVIVGAQLVVTGAVAVAERLGASESLIGLTVVAVGTSLPELATTIASARRGATELVIGNIFGSNVFNSLTVAGLTGLAGSGELSQPQVLPVAVMVVVSAVAVGAGAAGRSFTRLDGMVLLALYPAIVLVAA